MLALIFALVTMMHSGNVSIPFTYFDNRVLIDCMIDGQGPFVMVVDTGSPEVAITPETAVRINAHVHYAGMETGAGNSAFADGTTKLQKLSIGSMTFNDLDSGVIDLSEIRAKFHFPHLDGLIGYPIMKRFNTFINVDAGTFSLNTTRPAAPAGATSTPFQGVIPVIHVKIGGIPTTALVDTGDRFSLTLFGPFAKQHGFYDRYPSKKNIITGFGLGGPIYADVFTLPDLDVLSTPLTDIITRASRQTAGVFASSAAGGSIGTGILKRFNMVFDYKEGVIIAWPSKYFSAPDVFKPPG